MQEISSIAKLRLEHTLASLNEQIEKTGEEVETARGFGDLSENTEYEVAIAKYTKLTQEKAKIEYTLSTSTVRQTYSNNISYGSLISVQLIDAHGNSQEDLGLLMFDQKGSILFDGTISADSPLGRRIQGGLSGVYTVKGPSGADFRYKVSLEPESRLQEYLEKYPPSRSHKLNEIFSV